jgi:hypothetical protein
MNLKREEIEELEEQLILIYRFISQNNALKNFYYEGVDIKPLYKDETGMLNELIQHEDAEEILKTCILEIEESKEGEENKEFHEILDSYDIELLHQKYGMNCVEDVGKLNINKILNSL